MITLREVWLEVEIGPVGVWQSGSLIEMVSLQGAEVAKRVRKVTEQKDPIQHSPQKETNQNTEFKPILSREVVSVQGGLIRGWNR